MCAERGRRGKNNQEVNEMTPEQEMKEWIRFIRSLEAKVLVMQNVLDQARQTIELLNSVLKNTGDSSLDETSTHMLIQIDRVIHPEYFVNAPSAE
jgi:hypothetical protein